MTAKLILNVQRRTLNIESIILRIILGLWEIKVKNI